MVVGRAVLFGVLILGGCVLQAFKISWPSPKDRRGQSPRLASKRICNIALRVTALPLGAMDRPRWCSKARRLI